MKLFTRLHYLFKILLLVYNDVQKRLPDINKTLKLLTISTKTPTSKSKILSNITKLENQQ